MADAEDVVARPAGAAKKGKVDYVALEADVQAQLQVASQVRAPRAAAPPLRACVRTRARTSERRSPKTASACVCAALSSRRGASPRRSRRC